MEERGTTNKVSVAYDDLEYAHWLFALAMKSRTRTQWRTPVFQSKGSLVNKTRLKQNKDMVYSPPSIISLCYFHRVMVEGFQPCELK